MIRLWRRNFITVVTLCVVTGYAYPENLKYKLNNNKLRDTYNKLLKTVTSVSQERLNALNKFNELQNYLPKVGLRSDDEIVAVIIPSALEINHDTENDIYNEENVSHSDKRIRTIKDENINDDDDDNDIDSKNTSLRQWKGCNKSAAKTCRKACKRAYKDVCEDYKCSRSMKRSHKKACKRVCNSEFRGYDY